MEGATLESLGAALNISKERVRQIEQIAIGKLRDAMSGDHGKLIAGAAATGRIALTLDVG